MLTSLPDILLSFPSVLIALSFHEYAHGLVAYKLGDPTPARSGRLTINPLAHLDIVGTLMLLLFRFGWAKPVPIDPINFKNPRRDIILVALAGPLMNFILAVIFAIPLRFGIFGSEVVGKFFFNGLLINLALMVFNLIPVPPLDGSKILYGILPERVVYQLERFERYGMLLLLFLIVIGTINNIMYPIVVFFVKMLLL